MITSSESPGADVVLVFVLFGIAGIALGIGIIVTRRVPWLLQDGLLGLFKSQTSPPQPTRIGGFHALNGGTIVLGASAGFPSVPPVPHPVAVALNAAAFISLAASIACLIFVER